MALAAAVGALVGAGYLLVRARPEVADPAEHVARAEAAYAAGDLPHAVIELRNALQRDAGQREARLRLAELLVESGDGAGALHEVERARAAGVAREASEPLRLEALLLLGRHEEVLGSLAADWGADASARLLLLRGRAELALRRLDGAEASFRAALGLEPASVTAHLGLGAIALRRWRLEEVAEHVDAALALAPGDYLGWLMRGDVALAGARFPDALAAFDEAARLAPQRPQAHLGRVRAWIGQRRPDEAEAILGELGAGRAKVAEVHYWYGVAATQRGDAEAAIAAFRAMLRAVPDHEPSVLGLARHLAARGSHEQAAELLRGVLGAPGDHREARRLLAALLLHRGEADETVAILEPAVRGDGADPMSAAILGNALTRIGEAARGATLLAAAAAAMPDSEQVRGWYVAALVGAGRPDAALRALGAERNGGTGRSGGLAETLVVVQLLRSGRHDAAVSLAERLVERDPGSATARSLLGASLHASGRIEAARAAYRGALAIAPGAADANVNLARLDLAQGGSPEAWSRFAAVLESNPRDPRALAALAGQALGEGRVAEALTRLGDAVAANPRAPIPRVQLAALWLQLERPREALALAEEAVALAPRLPLARLVHARALLAAGRGKDALSVLTPLAAQFPRHREIGLAHGEARLASGKPTGALDIARAVLARDPSSHPARALLARSFLAMERFEEALSEASALRARSPEEVDGHALAGYALAGLGRLPEAAAELERALAARQKPELVVTLARIRHELGRSGLAERTLRGWLERRPGDDTVLLALGELLIARGHPTRAAQAYETLLERSPENATALNNLAWLYLSSDPGKALGVAERALALAPSRASVVDTYGWALVHNGRVEQGLTALRSAVALDPESPEQQYHLAFALARLGEKAPAREAVRRALDSARPGPWREAARELQATLR